MQCMIIQDLLPLFADGCCSDESREAVQMHLNACPDCRRMHDEMQTNIYEEVQTQPPTAVCKRVHERNAAVLQSALLFASFVIITFGVAMESRTPSGWSNGAWAFRLVIPTTGFMLSLANWYFIRLYTNRRRFRVACAMLTLGITACLFVAMSFYYDIFSSLIGIGWKDFLEAIPLFAALYAPGAVLTAVFSVISRLLSSVYASLLGKE